MRYSDIISEAASPKFTLRGDGMPEKNGKFGPGAKAFWTKVAKMAGRTEKPDFYMSEGRPILLMGYTLPKDTKTGLAMEGSFLVKFNRDGSVYTQASVWFPELPTAGVGVTAKPWKGFVSPADVSYRQGKDVSGGELVKALQRQRGEARSYAREKAGKGEWGQYKGQKESVGLNDLLGDLRESTRW